MAGVLVPPRDRSGWDAIVVVGVDRPNRPGSGGAGDDRAALVLRVKNWRRNSCLGIFGERLVSTRPRNIADLDYTAGVVLADQLVPGVEEAAVTSQTMGCDRLGSTEPVFWDGGGEARSCLNGAKWPCQFRSFSLNH